MANSVYFKRGCRRLVKALRRRAPLVCTVLGAAGVVATGILSAKAALDARDVLDEYERERVAGLSQREVSALPETSIYTEIKLTWKKWVLPVLVGSASIAAMVLSHRLSKKQIMALSASNAFLASQLNGIKGAIDRRIENTDVKRDLYLEAAKVRREDADEATGAFVLSKTGHLYFDDVTGEWFRQDPVIMEKARSEINKRYAIHNTVSLFEVYECYGFDKALIPDIWKSLGWDLDTMIEDWGGYEWIDIIFRDGNYESLIYPGVPECEDEFTMISYPIEPTPRYSFGDLTDGGIRADLVPIPAWPYKY